MRTVMAGAGLDGLAGETDASQERVPQVREQDVNQHTVIGVGKEVHEERTVGGSSARPGLDGWSWRVELADG